MVKTCCILTLVVVSAVRALGVAAVVDRALPAIDHWTVRAPMAAICHDGAAWLCWLQTSRRPGDDPEPIRVDAELHCRLIDRDKGTAVYQKVVRRWPDVGVPGNVNPAYLCATPDGDAVVFTRLIEPGRPESLDITLVSRTGAVASIRLATRFPAGHGWLHTRRAMRESGVGPFQVCFAADGTMHCFFWSEQKLTHAAVTRSQGELEVAQLESFHPYGRLGSTPRLDTAALKLKHLAAWRDHGCVFFASPDTLVAVFTDQLRTTEEVESGRSTDLKVYRFALPTLSFCESTQIPCADAAGTDWPGVDIACAVVARTVDGWTVFLPASGRTESYQMGPSGLPLPGVRQSSAARPFSSLREYTTETVDFLWLGRGKLHHIEWMGVDDTGCLYTDACVRRPESGGQH